MSIEKYISEAKRGKESGRREIFNHLSGRAKMLCLRYLQNHEDAEEVMQDGFYKFFTGLSKFTYESEAGVYAFFKKILINECLMQLRKKDRVHPLPESDLPETPIEAEALNKLNAHEVFRMIIYLPGPLRIVLNLYAIEGFDHKEIAEALQITENASRVRLSKARLLMKKLLTEKEFDYASQD